MLNLDWAKHVLDLLKTPGKYFLPLLLVSAFGLFAPFGILEKLGIGQWRTDGKLYLGSLFVVSCAFIFTYYFSMLVIWVLDWNNFYRRLYVGHSRLKSLTIEEQNIVRMYLEKNTKTLALNSLSGVVEGLAQANIIYPSVVEGDAYGFPFNIRDWAWIYLNKNPNLVGIIKDAAHTNNP